MRRRYLLLVVCCLLPVAFLWSCGSGPGAPGSSGSEKTGIGIRSVDMVLNSTKGDQGEDVDTNIHLCPPDFTKAEPGLFRVDATMTINASKLNPASDFNPFPASVQKCTITYIQPPDDLGAPPIEQWTVFPSCTLNSGSSSCVIDLIDIARKVEFFNNICAQIDSFGFCIRAGVFVPQKRPVRYVASYECIYTNIVGESGNFQGAQTIFLDDFNNCSS